MKNNEIVAYEDIIADLEHENAKLRAKQSRTPSETAGETDADDLNIELPLEDDGSSTPRAPAELEPAREAEGDSASTSFHSDAAGESTAIREALSITHLGLDVRAVAIPGHSDNNSDTVLKVIVQPRDQTENVVPVAGALTLVVLNPQLRTRVARWEFGVDQTRQWIEEASHDAGLHVPLPGSGKWREDQDLDLFVRYVTADGRRLEAQCPLRSVEPAEPSRWSRRAPANGSRGNSVRAASATMTRRVRVPAESVPEWSPRR
ncbi:MAG: hypothetical protein VX346_21030 [Planctomycetota bacterium]|nr:hypothetical protein [Planctomycetota bacterium]